MLDVRGTSRFSQLYHQSHPNVALKSPLHRVLAKLLLDSEVLTQRGLREIVQSLRTDWRSWMWLGASGRRMGTAITPQTLTGPTSTT